MAVLPLPPVLAENASEPIAVLRKPPSLLKRASKPKAVLLLPSLFMRASSPRTVFWFVKQPSWQTARACGEGAKQPSTNGRKNRLRRKGECFIEFLNGRVIVF